MSPPHTSAIASPPRYIELDGLRGLLVLAIVLLHYCVHHIESDPGTALAYLQKYMMWLWMGVDAFFVLSGFLIGGILLGNSNAKNRFSVFYLRRSLRIFPPYFLVIGSWLIFRVVWLGDIRFTWLMANELPWWPYLFYLQNFWMAIENHIGSLFVGPTWSLAIEEQFYLILPLLIWTFPKHRLPWLICFGFFGAALLRGACVTNGIEWESASSRLLPMRCDSLLAGVFVAYLVQDDKCSNWLISRRHWLVSCLPIATVSMALMPIIIKTAPSHSPLLSMAIYSFIAAYFAFIILVLRLNMVPLIAPLFKLRVLRFFGKISYTLYLLHVPILGLIFGYCLGREPRLTTGSDVICVTAAFAISVTVSLLSWVVIERPLVALGHRIPYRDRDGQLS